MRTRKLENALTKRAIRAARRRGVALAAMLAVGVGVSASAVDAQSSGSSGMLQQIEQSLTPAEVQQIQQVLGGGTASGPAPTQGQPQGPIVLQPQGQPATGAPPAGAPGTPAPGTPAPNPLSGLPSAPTPTVLPNAGVPQSRLEQIMSERARTRLTLFGYDQFGSGQSITVPQTGAVQDSYILGPGDDVKVSMRGQENADYDAVVDRNGQVVLPNIAPIPAAGRTLGDFRQSMIAAVKHAYISTQAFVSVAVLRQISVMVTGEVQNPGMRLVTALSTPIDAILLSGGVQKTGSLRDIMLVRNGQTTVIDLYDLIAHAGRSAPITLTDGDRILVPPLGHTVAVTGWVRRPAIYELPPGVSGISVREAMTLAGGLEVKGRYRLAVLRISPSGSTNMEPLAGESGAVHDGEILFVSPGAEQTEQRAILAGGTPLAGAYSVTRTTMLSDLLKAPGALGNTPYSLFGLIIRRDPKTQLPSLIAFAPAAVLDGRDDIALSSNDVVRVFTAKEEYLLSGIIRAFRAQERQLDDSVINPDQVQPSTTGPLVTVETSLQRQALVGLSAKTLGPGNVLTDLPPTAPLPPNFEDEAVRGAAYPSNLEIQTFQQLADQLQLDPLVLINFLMDHDTVISGDVLGAGDFLAGPHATLADLIAASGGASNWADLSRVEIISTEVDAETGRSSTKRELVALTDPSARAYQLKPQDQIRIDEIYSDVGVGTVTLQGQVRYPGVFDIERGERLSELLLRAGGLTDQAYPYGTIFLRKSAALLERQGFQRAADQLEESLEAGLAAGQITGGTIGAVSPDTVAAMQAFITGLRNRNGLGRISIVADPVMLAANPSRDPMLEPGDAVYIPQRPSTVAVLGEVMQGGSFPFSPKATVADYIDKAGGYGQLADESNTFLVLPDGSARQVESSWLNLDSPNVPPGSVIVVPRELFPISTAGLIVEVGEVLKDFAVSAASIAVISRNN